ncbi:Uncharacterised protein [Mycobacteroides abscessus subsp. abscessus]|nr:Uncharacterised protein [Mycobacteroides abscessus subsp. abscessus]
MAVRCYIPTTLAALGAGLTATIAVAPDATVSGLRADDIEEREFAAMGIAAALAAVDALGAQPPSPRVVVANDAPAAAARQPLAEGFDLLTLEGVDMDAVASFHLDEAEVWDEALSAGDIGSAEDRLGESDLLWYDRSELDDLLRARG